MTSKRHITAAEARRNFADAINQVRYGFEHLVVTRHGKPVAALISPESLAILEAFERLMDMEEVWDALNEVEVDGTVKWGELKKEIGL